MNWVVNEAFNNANLNQHTMLGLYLVDLVCTFNNEAQRNDVFQHTAKAIHANIKFTKEIKHQNQVNYLNVLLTWNNGFKFLVVHIM